MTVDIDFFEACTIYECLKLIVEISEYNEHRLDDLDDKAPVIAKAYQMIPKWGAIKETLARE